MNPILKRAAMVTAAVVIADQALKIWVKTHLFIGEGSYTNWGVGISQLQLKFVEDPAIPIALSIFRLLAIGGIVYYMIWFPSNLLPLERVEACFTLLSLTRRFEPRSYKNNTKNPRQILKSWGWGPKSESSFRVVGGKMG